jgi:alpha-tubulin suppressor-like RCC1 family protein
MEKRTSPVVCLALAALLWSSTTARPDIAQLEENPSAQPQSELLLTNTTDLVGLYLENYNFPIGSWVWAPRTCCPAVLFQPMTIVWADTGNLPSGLAGITNSVPTSLQGVNAFPLWVTLWPQSNTVTVLQPWSDATLTEFTVPDGFPSWQVYEANLYPSCILFGINYTNFEVLVEQGYTQFSVPLVIRHAWLMDVGSRNAYWNNLEAQSEAAQVAQAATAASMSRRVMPMDDGGGGSGGGDPCTLTSLLQAFAVTNVVRGANGATTITWQSCQFFRYLVFSASSLSTNTQWMPKAYVWGATNASVTSWTDTATTNSDGSTITQRFYRVQRFPETPIAAGGYFSLALTPDGKLWSWGANDDGQLGDGLSGDDDGIDGQCPSPGEVANLTTCFGQTINNPVALACGEDFFVVADATGTVWTCGGDDVGKLGWGPPPMDCHGSSPNNGFPPSPVPGISNVVSTAGGLSHTLALRGDGTLWAWGDDSYYQLGDGGLASSNAASTGGCAGTNSPVQSIFPSGTFIVDIAAGANHSVALDASGNVWTWGDGGSGQLGNGQNTNVGTPAQVAGVSNVIAIAAGTDHTIALTADRTVWTWGGDFGGMAGSGELGRGAPYSVPGQVSPRNLSNVVAIAAGNGFSLAVSNGYVYAFGQNGYGELGTNTGGGSLTTPTLVSGISNVLLVAAGATGYHSLAMTVAGGTNQYWAWGKNCEGQVGNGTNETGLCYGTGNDYQYVPAQAQFCTRCRRCVQLGTSGILTAQCNGTLYLYFNGQITDFSSYSGSYTVTVNNVTNTAVPATSGENIENGWPGNGVSFGTVTNGGIYRYTATGWCTNAADFASDPNGNGTNGTPLQCSIYDLNITNSVCPMWQCFSLVGKIQ